MKTFKWDYDIGFSKKVTSNFADYQIYKHENNICCGWMDLHRDDDEFKFYHIAIINIHPRAKFVIYDRSIQHYKIIDLKSGDRLKFNQHEYHGLLPDYLALEVIKHNSFNIKRYKFWKSRIDGYAFKPKLIWKFIKHNEKRSYF